MAVIFHEIADLLEIGEEETYKARVYRRAAQAVERLTEDLEVMAGEGRLETIPGVGPALAAKMREILDTGTCRYLERLRQDVPPGLRLLLNIPGVGARTVGLVYRRLGITSLAELEAAAREKRLRSLPGIGGKKEQHILQGIERMQGRVDRIPLGMALPAAEQMTHLLRLVPGVERADVAGSVRRGRETVGDINLVVASARPATVIAAFRSLPFVKEVVATGEDYCRVALHMGGETVLRVVPPGQFASVLQWLTGSAAHNRLLQERAPAYGFMVGEGGLRLPGDGGDRWPENEEHLYRLLGLSYIPPELREGRGEVEAAAAGRLPVLLTEADIRGDLHVHTLWSDGVNSLEEMAARARARGYSYLGICEHSRSLGVAGGLSLERLRRQWEEIRNLNERWDDIRLLTGIEVDIMTDGSLDFEDEVLAEADVVVASIHRGFRQEERMITDRIVNAMRNPHVDIIGHPTGRLLGRRDPYRVDIDEVLGVAAETGTILELNASPDRLDLTDEYLARARELGVLIAINTDAHSVAGLDDMTYGVLTARRGWLEKHHVVNSLEATELLALFRDRAGVSGVRR